MSARRVGRAEDLSHLGQKGPPRFDTLPTPGYIAKAPRGRPTVRVKGSTRPLLSSDNLLFLAPTADHGRKERRCVMSEPTSTPLSLPESPSLDWLRKQAKRRLGELRKANPAARLADAQFDLARQYGFASWRALK